MTNERTADADADAALLRDALGLPDDYGDENTAIIQRQHAALDRLVARNQQLQEAAMDLAMAVLIRSEPLPGDIVGQAQDVAALASVRARTP